MTTGTRFVRSSSRTLRRTSNPPDLGKLQVEQDQGGRLVGIAARVFARSEQVVQALRPVGGHHDVVVHVVLLEGVESQLHVVRVVFDKENCCLVHGSLPLM